MLFVQFQDLGHRAVEEGPIVRHDDQASLVPAHPRLQSGQTFEIEVIGGLVQQGEVEAGEHDGRQGSPGLLPTRERATS